MVPREEDYEFFYQILRQYADHYGKDAKIADLPAMTLIANDTIEDSIKVIRKKLVFDGWVIFRMPVLRGHVTPNGYILNVEDEESWITVGRVNSLDTTQLMDGTIVYHAQIGKEQILDVAEDDILYFGEDVKEYLKTDDIWNFVFYEESTGTFNF
jgi:hypothetical protein